jgi:hypothetical protein
MVVTPETGPGSEQFDVTPSIDSTRELLITPELRPVAEVTIDDRVFALSSVVQSYNYDRAVMYTCAQTSDGPRMVPRLLYKSNSDGGWRVTYGTIGGKYHKVMDDGGHYVQETKLHTDLLEAIEKLPKEKDLDEGIGERIERIFGAHAYMDAFTAYGEITYFKDMQLDKKLAPFRLLRPGQFTYVARIAASAEGCDNVREYFVKANTAFVGLPGFVPDFRNPVRSTTQEHTLLGNIQIEDFEAKIGDEPLIWSMAQDRQGRTWVDNIHLTHNRISSYGTYSVVFDAGFITSKPLDYKRNTDGLLHGDESQTFNRRYVDITPVLSSVLPIAEYKRMREFRRSI